MFIRVCSERGQMLICIGGVTQRKRKGKSLFSPKLSLFYDANRCHSPSFSLTCRLYQVEGSFIKMKGEWKKNAEREREREEEKNSILLTVKKKEKDIGSNKPKSCLFPESYTMRTHTFRTLRFSFRCISCYHITLLCIHRARMYNSPLYGNKSNRKD